MSNRRFRVFLKSGITPEISDSVLRSHFEGYGEVLDVYIPKDTNTRQPRGFAFVSMDNEESVRRATAELTHEILGRHIPVGRADPRPSDAATGFTDKPSRRSGPHNPNFIPLPPDNLGPRREVPRPVSPPMQMHAPLRVYDGGLIGSEPIFITPGGGSPLVGRVLGDYGVLEQHAGYGGGGAGGGGGPRGGLHGMGAGGGGMGGQGRGQKEDLGKGPRIFVGGIPDELTERDLKAHFEKYGTVEDIYFPKEKASGKRRGFCYIRFDSERTAEAAAARSPRTIAGKDIGEIKVAAPRPDDGRRPGADLGPPPMDRPLLEDYRSASAGMVQLAGTPSREYAGYGSVGDYVIGGPSTQAGMLPPGTQFVVAQAPMPGATYATGGDFGMARRELRGPARYRPY